MIRYNLIELLTLELADDLKKYCNRMEYPMVTYDHIRQWFRDSGLTDDELHEELEGIRTDMAFPIGDVYDAIWEQFGHD